MIEQGSSLPLYSIYGLTIASDIALPELCVAQAGAQPDIVIRKGEVPTIFAETDPNNLRSILDGTPGHLWIRIAGTMRMSMRAGRTLDYTVEPGCKEDSLRLFLLGTGLGALLMQRGFVVVHGNAITLPGRTDAIVCIGDSGAGKSTTAIAMMQRGYAILADDVCPIDPDYRIEPGMPRAKLWAETARHLNIDTGGLTQIRDGDAKFNLPLGDSHCREARTIHSFIWLVPDEVEEISCSEVTGVEKFVVLRNNIYRPEYLLPLALEADYLQHVTRIAAQARVFKLVRPKARFVIDPVLDEIGRIYEQCSGELETPAQL